MIKVLYVPQDSRTLSKYKKKMNKVKQKSKLQCKSPNAAF